MIRPSEPAGPRESQRARHHRQRRPSPRTAEDCKFCPPRLPSVTGATVPVHIPSFYTAAAAAGLLRRRRALRRSASSTASALVPSLPSGLKDRDAPPSDASRRAGGAPTARGPSGPDLLSRPLGLRSFPPPGLEPGTSPGTSAAAPGRRGSPPSLRPLGRRAPAGVRSGERRGPGERTRR